MDNSKLEQLNQIAVKLSDIIDNSKTTQVIPKDRPLWHMADQRNMQQMIRIVEEKVERIWSRIQQMSKDFVELERKQYLSKDLIDGMREFIKVKIDE